MWVALLKCGAVPAECDSARPSPHQRIGMVAGVGQAARQGLHHYAPGFLVAPRVSRTIGGPDLQWAVGQALERRLKADDGKLQACITCLPASLPCCSTEPVDGVCSRWSVGDASFVDRGTWSATRAVLQLPSIPQRRLLGPCFVPACRPAQDSPQQRVLFALHPTKSCASAH